ncbi:MAG: hypothetical protein SPL99_06445 [Catonella sp.]|nr:hypothetical protein [Catonella sp.]MDY6356350.1 hypothetical protein [Catonella sp.]
MQKAINDASEILVDEKTFDDYMSRFSEISSRFELVRHQLNTDGVQSIAFSNMVNAAKSLNTDFNEFGELIGEMDKTFVKATSTLIAADSNIGKLINKNT